MSMSWQPHAIHVKKGGGKTHMPTDRNVGSRSHLGHYAINAVHWNTAV